jgi:hypothetical protein
VEVKSQNDFMDIMVSLTIVLPEYECDLSHLQILFLTISNLIFSLAWLMFKGFIIRDSWGILQKYDRKNDFHVDNFKLVSHVLLSCIRCVCFPCVILFNA